jgi:diguanylate cyclase (GGDEF)-like protein
LSPAIAGDNVVLVEQTRFATAAIVARYADGHVERLSVRSGALGDAWAVGGRLAFHLPERAAPLVDVALGFERLASYPLVRSVDIVSAATEADREDRWQVVAALCLGILLASLLNSGFLYAGLGNRFLVHHLAWLASVLLWGLSWTQLLLPLVPALGGSWTVRLNSLFAGNAVCFAALFFLAFVNDARLSARFRRAVAVMAWSVPGLSLLAAADMLVPTLLANRVQEAMIVAVMLATLGGALLAWHRGSHDARFYVAIWMLPMLAVLLRVLPGFGVPVPDEMAEIAVLVSAALQAIALGAATAARFVRLRAERDHARAERAVAAELAETDQLTGLYNRRGFVSRAQEMLAAWPAAGLVVMDVDHFKAVNDSFGHDVGDRLLIEVAAVIYAAAGSDVVVGRLGGEEFGLVVPRGDVAALAERVRHAVSHASAPDVPRVTISGGVATSRSIGTSSFERLYRAADQALYEAKAAGRDRVVVAGQSRPGLNAVA